MGIKERRNEEKEEMKKKIRNAAIDIIEKEGYEKLSIRKIAAKIEYSPTTIYLYYQDKAEIITDMCNELYRKVMVSVISATKEDAALSIEKQVHNILIVFIKGLLSEPEMVKAIMYSGINVIYANNDTDELPSNPGIEMLDHLLFKGVTQKVFKPDMEGKSWMIVSALIGFVLSSIGNKLYLLEHFHKYIDDFVKILLGGISSENSK